MKTILRLPPLGLLVALLAGLPDPDTCRAAQVSPIAIPIGEFTPGTWTIGGQTFNRKRVYTPFDGPNVTQNQSVDFPNPSNLPVLKVSTTNAANATTLDTLILISTEAFPSASKRTNDNVNANTKLSAATFTMTSQTQYRVTVYYKSATLPTGKTNVWFDWTYSN